MSRITKRGASANLPGKIYGIQVIGLIFLIFGFMFLAGLPYCQSLQPGAILKTMDVVERLEIGIRALLERHELLREENRRLADGISVLTREKQMLEKENRDLHESLARQEILRIEALRRLDGLLRKIQDYEKVGQVDL